MIQRRDLLLAHSEAVAAAGGLLRALNDYQQAYICVYSRESEDLSEAIAGLHILTNKLYEGRP